MRRTKQERQADGEAAMRLQNAFRRVQRARTPEERAAIWEQAKQDRMLLGRLPEPTRQHVSDQAAAEAAYQRGDAL